MKIRTYVSALFAMLVVTGCATAPTAAEKAAQIQVAIDNPNRSDADRERDARDKPEVTLALLDLAPGDAAVDLFGGGGYYAELIASIVGEQGSVVLQNNAGYAKWVDKYLQERFIDNTVVPIEVLQSEVIDLQLGENRFDAALMVMSYHDLYYYNPERGFDRTDVADVFAQLSTALKPGGKLLIIDHSAPVGTGKTLTQDIHRIDENFAKQDIAGYGFRLLTTSDALRNPADPRTANVFTKAIRGKTDRFVLVFEKN